jgi:fructosamine-3-kinase
LSNWLKIRCNNQMLITNKWRNFFQQNRIVWKVLIKKRTEIKLQQFRQRILVFGFVCGYLFFVATTTIFE